MSSHEGAEEMGDIVGRQLSFDHRHERLERQLTNEDREELRRIASTMTKPNAREKYQGDADSDVWTKDPASDDFDLYKWLMAFSDDLRREGINLTKTGVSIRSLNVSGNGSELEVEETFWSALTSPFRFREKFRRKKSKHILRNFDALLKEGELLVVLGRPGSGCSTFLKTICGEVHGLSISAESRVHYNGITQSQMKKEFKGEILYNQEVDKHFPHLTVGQTLEFAASVRAPYQRVGGMSRSAWAKHITKVIMAVFGLRHTYNTKVGNDFIRCVSGGERKRVSIAEMAIAAAPLAAWDNSTRGLDSGTALEFIKALRLTVDLGWSTHAVAIYQASQAIYDLFDKAIVLYEGREIYYGSASKAKQFFEDQGWQCPPRQTTGDFLTSVTNPMERQPRLGMERVVPRTPDEFEHYWRSSREYEALQKELNEYDLVYPPGGGTLTDFRKKKTSVQAKHTSAKSPYRLSILMQIQLNTKRAYQRIWNDITSTVTNVVTRIILALIIGSLFYGAADSTASFGSRTATLFFAILLNALVAITEINTLYAQRPIIEKHASYAFYHPFTEAVAGIVSDVPIKFLLAVAFNIILYFLANLRREASNFFLYLLVVFVSMFVMSALFRTLAASTKTVSQAMGLAGLVVLALAVYTGFVIPTPYMKDWFKWIHWINPIYYSLEILVANEFHGRRFPCAQYVPAYPDLTGNTFVCSTPGSRAGESTVLGDDYIATFGYSYSHVWRNFGILCGFLLFFMAFYFVATELNSSSSSSAEVLVFRRGHIPTAIKDEQKHHGSDEEQTVGHGQMNELTTSIEDNELGAIAPQTDIFTWKDVSYDINTKDGTRRLLDNISGWVRPGTLTALMGASGAGKTTLLDVLAQRKSVGVITGATFVDGSPTGADFQRNTGYVQQQDLHLQTATVRESLRFSALLRQPTSVSKADKYAYVEEVIKLLNMEDFAEAAVGIPGQGLNVEQRKLLSIGVELAAKPKLLLFLDEPTSGLDSQSSWAICAFLRKLADAGQAVLCTIHQPSAILFEQFDRLLFLAKGGKTVYFGDVGQGSQTLLQYFRTNGARECGHGENPAEYILEVITTTPSNGRHQDWHKVWQASPERAFVDREVTRLNDEGTKRLTDSATTSRKSEEFAAPFFTQLYHLSRRVFQQYWRTPTYLFSKLGLGISSGLFIGFSVYQSPNSLQGIQNVIFSIFMISTIFTVLVQQIMPHFITQRNLYEVRERPSKAYSWKAFLIANIVIEIPYQIVLGIMVFGCWNYAVNGIQSSDRQVLILLFCIQFFVYASSFAHMVVAGLPDEQTASAIVTLLFGMSLAFNGVMQSPDALPGFWIFMYRVSPFTYWVGGIASYALHGRPVECSNSESSIFDPPQNQTCSDYLERYLAVAPGYLTNPAATSDCRYCSLRVADHYMAQSNIFWSERWRNFGLVWVYFIFNIAVATILYWALRVKRWDTVWTGRVGTSPFRKRGSRKKSRSG